MAFGSKRRLVAMGGAAPFSLSAFMARQSDGFFYDFTRTDRHFQEHTGPTLADDIGESIGLALDQRTWAGATPSSAFGPELVPDSTLSDVSALTLQTDWSASAGVVTKAGGASGRFVSVTGSLATVGATYYSTTVVSARSAGTVLVNIGSVDGVGRTAAGTYTEYVRATTTGTPSPAGLTLYGDSTFAGSVDSLSVRLVPGYSALQSTGAAKPTRQAGGAKFDGSDDNLLTTYYAGSGSNFIVALVTIPASIPVAQVVIGAFGGGADRSFLSVNTSGFAYFGLGSLAGGAQVGTTDIRGTETVIGLSFDGSTARLFVGSSMEYSGAQSGSPTTTVPYRLGALNSSGTAFNFFAGSIKKIVAGREHLTLARYLQIRAALLA